MAEPLNAGGRDTHLNTSNFKCVGDAQIYTKPRTHIWCTMQMANIPMVATTK